MPLLRGRPDEVAAVLAFIRSQSASFVIKSNDRVDGGWVLSVDLRVGRRVGVGR